MTEFLCPTVQLMVLLPGLLLAYLPMKQHLRMPPARLAALMGSVTLLLCIAGGRLCRFLSLDASWMLLILAALAGVAYIHTLRVTWWKSVSVFLAVFGVFSCLDSLARILDLILLPGNTTPWLSIPTALLYNGLCWVFVGITWYPATHSVRTLLDDENLAQTWFVFWTVPLLFIALNRFISPIHPELMYQGRILQIYIVVILSLLLLLLLFYAMFYLMASSLNRNHQLQQENQFLSMQQNQYDNLRTAIAETREARHDMRHHVSVLQNLAVRQEWEALEAYLCEAWQSIPAAELNLCDNAAVDGIASHYGLLCRKHDIPFSFALDLPQALPVPEIDLCLVLSNLLENALEASLKTEPSKRRIQAQAYLHSDHMVLLTVENAFDGTVEEKNGVFQSSKRKGDGVGIQSVRRIAEKNGGYSRFYCENGSFHANVMLRTGT